MEIIGPTARSLKISQKNRLDLPTVGSLIMEPEDTSMTKILFASLLALGTLQFFSLGAYAHGEDKPGPHGGFIRMPGPFHVEVKAPNLKTVHVYLLDMSWANPTTQNSTVAAEAEPGGTAKCQIQKKNFFKCEFPAQTNLKKPGLLRIKAVRDGQQGNSAEYQLPLQLTTPPAAASSPAPEAHHH